MAKLGIYTPKLWKIEGGFVNDPDDAGGATNHGVTFAVFVEFCKSKGRPKPTIADLKAISYDDFCEITKSRYWDKWQADKIDNQSIAELLVDWVYNSGSYGIKIPQRVLGLDDDGKVGMQTLGAVNGSDASGVFKKLWLARKQFYLDIVARNPRQEKFLKGWMNRLNEFKFKANGNHRQI